MLIDQDAMQSVREHELDVIASLLPRRGRVLEIGGGAGWQAAALSRRGFDVASVDVADNPYAGVAVWPVTLYDGRRLPFADASFDAVFSSNVLEHVEHLPELIDEMARVVRPGGRAVHLMPTSGWRAATSFAHYPWLVRMAISRLSGRRPSLEGTVTGALPRRSFGTIISRLLIAPRHGATGNVWSELYTYSAHAWRKQLARPGWQLQSLGGAGIFYSGYFVTHPWLARDDRRALSRWIGSGCNFYVLTRVSGS